MLLLRNFVLLSFYFRFLASIVSSSHRSSSLLWLPLPQFIFRTPLLQLSRNEDNRSALLGVSLSLYSKTFLSVAGVQYPSLACGTTLHSLRRHLSAAE